ncbi:MAG: hypothetical protein A3I92_00530 [Candidatus Yanofskybacteria bacterium RIFCSPLOWO2_02_FULL_43_10b]|uniref:Uncharacterized protein n=1 Tax=Candidatus Yanofskybacteria bacterium RIFCSPLOWO2_02_FULL_43_10b TaxID=1802704 RepID=A0A1F8H1G1_9BACT|nr:MAG: hypothetical protein A3I92_00530 [Candidatus Yanofskybacteria bacterium RIFCSPLOWO2_02_FULL_43_10b]
MDNKPILVWVLVALVIGLVGGYYFGDNQGFKRAEANLKKIQEEAADKAAAAAAKAANPFQAANPLEGVQDDPFAKTKSILNPFK